MKCPKCNYENDNKCKFCINCGYPLQIVSITPELQPVKPRKPWYKRWWIWFLMGMGTLTLFVFGRTVFLNSIHTNKSNTSDETDIVAEDIIDNMIDNGYEEVSASVLYNHCEDYKGKNIITAVKVTNDAYHTLYSDIDEDDFLASLCFSFDSDTESKKAKVGDYAIIAGTGDGYSIIGQYRDFRECKLIDTGEQARIEYDKLVREAIDTEKKIQSEAEEKAASEKKEFISSCKKIDYIDLVRNPDKHKGENFEFTGKVIQFQSDFGENNYFMLMEVTKTENEYLGDMYDDIVYFTLELPKGTDRLLENDIVTVWGTCEGSKEYTALLGNQNFVPAVAVKYFELVKHDD